MTALCITPRLRTQLLLPLALKRGHRQDIHNHPVLWIPALTLQRQLQLLLPLALKRGHRQDGHPQVIICC